MAKIVYVSHPQVTVDPDTPVGRWGLSSVGRSRARAMLGQPWLQTVGRVISSDEHKAVETAEVVASHLRLEVEVREGLGEMDRTATGFLQPAEFEAVAEAFFRSPGESVRGWERAVDAQTRIVTGLADLFETDADADVDVVVVGHGGVGTLWYCHLVGVPISRRWDQRTQGNFFTVDVASATPLHPWWPIDGPPAPDANEF